MGRFDKWEEQRPNKERKNASLDELKLLTRLTCLQILVTNAESLPEDLSFKNLERYNIDLTHAIYLDWRWDWRRDQSCRSLLLSHINKNICLNDGHIMQLKGTEDLCLSGLEDMKNVVYGLGRDGFQQLKHLQIFDNPNLLRIVDSNNYLTGNAFPRLESLDLSSLHSLEKKCGSQVTAESFSQLRTIEVDSCGKLENIFSFSIARRLEKLQSIEVMNCWNMKEIFAIEREDESNNNIELSQLRSLKLCFLEKLRSFSSTSQQKRDEIVSNALFSGKVVLPSLEMLELYCLKQVDLIWENQFAAVSSNIKNLTRLIIRDCENLRCLFLSSVASSFVQLQHLEIQNCDGLEEIVVINERNDVVFPQLQFLKMERLKNLTKFCLGDCIEFPSLKELKIEKCPKLKEFLVRNNTSNHITEIPISFFNNKVCLPRLETLTMTEIHSSECDEVKSPFGGGDMDHLVHLELEACERLIKLLTSSATKGMLRLGEIRISKCHMITEIMAADKGDEAKDKVIIFSELKVLLLDDLESLTSFCSANCTFKFPSLVDLGVWKCPKMKSIFTSSTVKSLERLRKIDIRECHLITEIVTADKGDDAKDCEIVLGELKELKFLWMQNLTSICSANCTLKFPSLIGLSVFGCPKMMSILTSSTAKSLGRLREMTIWKCDMTTEIMAADKGDEAKDSEIVFNQLTVLGLHDLPSLTSFCSNNYTLIFPSLERLIVENCPKMKNFSKGELSIPKLQKVKRSYMDKAGCWTDDPNTTIEQLHQEMKVQSFEEDFGQPSTQQQHHLE